MRSTIPKPIRSDCFFTARDTRRINNQTVQVPIPVALLDKDA